MGPFILDLHTFELDAEERELLAHPTVGGVIFFSRNYHDKAQLRALVKSIRAINPQLLLTVDHEGGRVQRFREQFFPLPAPGALAHYQGEDKLSLIQDAAWLMAAELLALDIDLSFAPVLDLARGSEVIGDRSFGENPAEVITHAGAYIKGLHLAGMASVAKHFPGHGSVRADSHKESPVDNRDFKTITELDMVPFKELIAKGVVQGVMPAHVIYSHVDEKPAGFSPLWLKQILRQQLGFTGLIFSDDLTMEGAAVVGGYAARAYSALQAGCEVLLACNHRAGAVEIIDALPHHLQCDLAPLRAQRQTSATSIQADMPLESHPHWQAASRRMQDFLARE
ncbi:beta-N-acetylhexosaminidase [Oceanisphaera avium]|uniref:Beta-hexosaminidase n=1 Tax=Oceanisphaera avium TaxID=1903694 RepID=A0A1Y0CUH8_9GAMM|nr:beta-N-acetylhexosaminidase [Oceanisphaera avium]ART79000.1 beta-N-acetylhexosaminidase [Oceanisphaera avium]